MQRAAATLLDRLSDGDRENLIRLGTRRRYPPGSRIFLEAEPAHEVVLLVEGEVKVVVGSVDGREVILDVAGPGSVVGELAPIDGALRSASCVTLGPVEIVAIPSETFAAHLRAHPDVLFEFTVMLAERVRVSAQRQLEFGTGDSLARLCRRLLDLADRYGTERDGTIAVASPLSQAELGAWSGLSREAIVKSMRRLRTLGWLDNEGSVITLLDVASIRERAG